MGISPRRGVFILIFSIILLLAFCGTVALAGRDNTGLQEYPGGDYGVDLGGGYEVTPDGQLLPPQGYRDDYRKTKYGPMTQTGFVVFPGFEFADSAAASDAAKKKEEEKTGALIFYEYTTSPAGNSIWGVSSPRK